MNNTNKIYEKLSQRLQSDKDFKDEFLSERELETIAGGLSLTLTRLKARVILKR